MLGTLLKCLVAQCFHRGAKTMGCFHKAPIHYGGRGESRPVLGWSAACPRSLPWEQAPLTLSAVFSKYPNAQYGAGWIQC